MTQVDYNQSVVTALIQDAIARQPRGASARLAETLGVTAQTVSKWVKGQTVPRMEDWPRVAEALGLPASAFHDAVFGETPASAARLDTVEEQLTAALDRLTRLEGMVEEVMRLLAPGNGPRPKRGGK